MCKSTATGIILVFSRFTLFPVIEHNVLHVANVGYWFQMYVTVQIYYNVFLSIIPQLGEQAGPPLLVNWVVWWWMFWIYAFWCFLLLVGVPAPVFFQTTEEDPMIILQIYLAGGAKLVSVLIVMLLWIVPSVKSTQLQMYCCQRFGLDSDFVLGPMMFFVVFTFFQSTAYTLYDWLNA